MAKFNHENSYFYMFLAEDFTVEFDFTDNIASGDTLSTATIVVLDSEGVDQSTTMVANKTVSSPDVTFTIQNPPAVGTYEIKITTTTVNSANHIGKIICDVFESVTLNQKLGDPTANSYVTLKEANDYIRNVRGHPNNWDTLSVEGRKRVLIQAAKDIDRFNFIGKKYYDNQVLEFPRDDHPVLTGNCASLFTVKSFKNTNFKNTTYGAYRYNPNYWKYGTIHITSATPLREIREIASNNVVTNYVSVATSFSDTPTANTAFIAFEPVDSKVKEAQYEQALNILDRDGGGTLQNYISLGARRVQIGDVEVDFGSGSSSSSGMKTTISPKAKRLLSQWFEKFKRIARA